MNFKTIHFTVIFFFLVLFYSCQSQTIEYKKLSGFIQGTTYHITYENSVSKDLTVEIENILKDFDQSLSIYQPNSVISGINRNDENVKPDKHFIKVYEEAVEVNKNTGGVFDVTVAPLVNAWGFGFEEKKEVDSKLVDSLLQFVGMEKVKLSNGTLIKQDPRIMFDFNAIAQGYSVDIVADYIESLGIKNYLVEIGGEIKAKGKNPKNDSWKVGIDKPIENNNIPGASLQNIIKIDDCSLATSGNYRKFFEKEGKKYTHFIDPISGYPIYSNLLSITVIAKDCITADAYATAFMIMGLEKTKKYLEKNKEFEAFLIFSDEKGGFQTYSTKGMDKMILNTN